MAIGHPPQNKKNRFDEFRTVEHADNVRPLRRENAWLQAIESPDRSDEFFDVLAPMLEEPTELQGDQSPCHESNELIRLLEENGRLRKLAVELSNLVGDLPVGRDIEPDVVARLYVIGDQLKAS